MSFFSFLIKKITKLIKTLPNPRYTLALQLLAMSKILQFTIIITYTLLTTIVTLALLSLYKIHLPYPTNILLATIWLGLCLGSIYLMPIYLPFYITNTRKPALTEEQRLRKYLLELTSKVGISTPFRLLIVYSGDIDPPFR